MPKCTKAFRESAEERLAFQRVAQRLLGEGFYQGKGYDRLRHSLEQKATKATFELDRPNERMWNGVGRAQQQY